MMVQPRWPLVLLCIMAIAGAPHALAQKAGDPAPAASDLSPSLKMIIEARDLPALGVIAIRDGRVVAQGAAGVRSLDADDAVTNEDLWHIGSCTKAMTATLAARLVDAGLIKWNTTIGETLAQVDGLGDQILPAYRDVTLRQLFCHRSGLPEDRIPDPTIWTKVRALDGPMIEQRRAALALVLSRAPASEPGSTMAYSNFGYVAAAAMVEQITDRPWEDLIKDYVFDPLGMSSAGFGPPSADAEDHEQITQPWGHRLVGANLKPVPPWLPMADNPAVWRPAGGVRLTLRDWTKFAAVQIAGVRGDDKTFLTAESWKTLREDVYKQRYAMGWVLGQRPWAKGLVLTHSGSNSMWFCVIWVAPNQNAAVMAATNVTSAGSGSGCDEAVVAALRAMELIPPAR